MSKLIQPAIELLAYRHLQVTPITSSANSHAPRIEPPSAAVVTPGKVDKSNPPTLESLDKRHGPLTLGKFTISRVELEAMGARIGGQNVSPQNVNIKVADQAFLDSMSFHPAKVLARMASAEIADASLVGTLMFEIATLRSVEAPPLMVSADPITPGSSMERLDKLTRAAQQIDIHRVDSLDHLPGWINRSKSYLTSGAGVGLQAYGIYSGLMGIVDAVKVRDWGEAAFNGGSVVAEVESLIIERGLSITGEKMLRSGGMVFNRFPATSAGKFLSRGAGLFASAITLPFDIISAVKSFNAAATTTGKEQQDHYVAGATAVAGATVSITLGIAALAGFGSVAGPAGLVAAAVLILGSEIYRAARVVDDIDDYIELTALERLRSGWFAFTRQELDEDVMDRFKISKYTADYNRLLQTSAQALLDGAYKHYVAHVVNGSFNVELEPVKVWRYQWDAAKGEKPYKMDKETIVVEGNDIIDARDGLPADLQGVVTGTADADKAVLWNLGAGDDQVTGVKARPNLFTYKKGTKLLTGGDKDDTFYFESAASELDRGTPPATLSMIDGGEGSDTLTFEGARPPGDTRYVGYDVNLQTGKVALRSHDATVDPVDVAQVKSVENVLTLRNGSNRITGSDGDNQISANGSDQVMAGSGNDVIAIRGADCRVDGGSGMDRYIIPATSTRPVIIDDGEEVSVIEFTWALERIQRWQIIGTSMVITSLHGPDGEDLDHELTIEAVYQQVDSKRVLKNSRLLFKTQDRYELEALLPLELNDPADHDFECRVIVIGDAPPAPYIANSDSAAIFTHPAVHHFAPRSGQRINFFAPANSPAAAKTLYLDYDAWEIHDVRVSYDVTVTRNDAGVRYLRYEQINLWIFLPSKTLNFTGVIKATSDPRGSTGINGIKTTIVQVRHPVVLIMRDGTSYNVAAPRVPYREDADTPGAKTLTARECLKLRHGKYKFVRPGLLKPFLLKATPHEINFPALPHNGTYVLHGQASTYDVYPISNSTFSLVTPGAIAQTSNASTWTIFTTKMHEKVTRNDIRLDAKNLYIGSVTMLLPNMEHEGPVESISVATSAGNIYAVELLFDLLQLTVIDARGYANLAELLADIRAHRDRNELSTTVVVKHLDVTPAINGTVHYHSAQDYWGVDTNPTLRIATENLTIKPSKAT
ncbi:MULTISPECIES: calcium-binding protein [unclassified Pseudomonas]|uniref:calcium-binding protein n=1 Tax=unclassified Pseudomonas TaxID=196821 RepID=UPI001B33CA7D|nr:calcium-binding protein [Pseudomonas sp. P116]MBP5947088.1 calcium-binding protein [Pseudomonas sp. P9(2020)]MBZ9565241.1 calcium-binding protein [Pseudomonas sp. P116]